MLDRIEKRPKRLYTPKEVHAPVINGQRVWMDACHREIKMETYWVLSAVARCCGER